MNIISKGGPLERTFVSILQPGVRRGASISECPMSQKQLVMGQSMQLLQKKKKKCEHTHEPINMNHNMLFNTDYTIWHTSMVKRLGILKLIVVLIIERA
jgi:hypothetical protein